MAVSEVITLSEGVGGDASGRDATVVRSAYSSRYLVKCDTLTDAPNVVLAHFRATISLPWPGRSFRLGGHTDRSAPCNKVNVERVPEGAGMYHVTASYSQADGPQQQQPDINGKMTENPLRWRDEIDVSFAPIAQAVQVAKFHGFRNSRFVNKFLEVGSMAVPMNSALVPYDPGIEAELPIKVIRITKNAAAYNDVAFNRLQGSVNASDVWIVKPAYNFAAFIHATRGRLHMGASYAITNDIPYWRLTAEIHVNPIGWRKELLDRGYTRRAAPGDPDAVGGTIPPLTSIPIAGEPTSAAILDTDGHPISEPVLLNGDGQPNESRYPPVWGVWQVYEEMNWNGFTW